MDQEQFVNAVKEVVRDSSIDGLVQILENPPGRSPDRKLIELSSWYTKLDADQQLHVKGVIEMAVNTGIFGLLCVIDGVRAVKKSSDSIDGAFKLSFIHGKEESIINDPELDYLHDLYNS